MSNEFRPPILQGDGGDAVTARFAEDGSPHLAVARDACPSSAVAQECDPPAANMAATPVRTIRFLGGYTSVMESSDWY